MEKKLIISKKLGIFFFLSLFISLYFNENSSGGAKIDSEITAQFIEKFNYSFSEGVEYFLKTNQIHSPFFYYLKATSIKILGQNFSNIIYLILSFLISNSFYICLKKKFKKVDRDYLKLISYIIFFSPYFRSSAVWFTSDNLALLFFVLSINKMLNISSKNKIDQKSLFLATLFLIIASYIRQTYAFFYILIFFKLIKFNSYKFLTIHLIYTSILSVPALAYLYFFITKTTGTSLIKINYVNNLSIFFSLFFFYVFPFIINNSFKTILLKNIRNKIIIFFISFLLLSLLLYDLNFYNLLGGGVFIKLSSLMNTKYIFIFFSTLGFVTFVILFSDNYKYLMPFILLVLSFPFDIIYQKYFDPIIIIILFTLISNSYLEKIIKNKEVKIKIIYIYFLTFWIFSTIYYT
jgi:hypothetical protein